MTALKTVFPMRCCSPISIIAHLRHINHRWSSTCFMFYPASNNFIIIIGCLESSCPFFNILIYNFSGIILVVFWKVLQNNSVEICSIIMDLRKSFLYMGYVLYLNMVLQVNRNFSYCWHNTALIVIMEHSFPVIN